jgi:hypothetical protein
MVRAAEQELGIKGVDAYVLKSFQCSGIAFLFPQIVVLTSALVENLDDLELEGVVFHEMTHLAEKELRTWVNYTGTWLLFLTLAGPLLAVTCLLQNTSFLGHINYPVVAVPLLFLAWLGLLVMSRTQKRVCRESLERRADEAGRRRIGTEPYNRTLAKIFRLNQLPHIDQPLYPPTKERLGLDYQEPPKMKGWMLWYPLLLCLLSVVVTTLSLQYFRSPWLIPARIQGPAVLDKQGDVAELQWVANRLQYSLSQKEDADSYVLLALINDKLGRSRNALQAMDQAVRCYQTYDVSVFAESASIVNLHRKLRARSELKSHDDSTEG